MPRTVATDILILGAGGAGLFAALHEGADAGTAVAAADAAGRPHAAAPRLG